MRIDALDTIEVLPCAVRTATANGSAVDIREYVGRLALTLMSAAASAGDTLDVKVQDSANGSSGWADISGAAFTQVTSAADAHESISIDTNAAKRYIRVVATIAGNGGESIACGVTAFGQQQSF